MYACLLSVYACMLGVYVCWGGVLLSGGVFAGARSSLADTMS